MKESMQQTPLMAQFFKIKEAKPDTTLPFRVGDFFETFDALIMIVNEEGRILFISPNVDNRFFYKPRSETIGKKFDEIFPKGQADFFLSHCLESIEKNEIVTIEYHLPIENMVRWFQSQAIPVQVTDSESKKVVTIIRDVTELKTKTN